jgi:transcriptional regulator with XRE-family HTH domain
MDVNAFVGQRIRRRRRLMDLTQEQLADVCGVSVQQMQLYESAHTRLSVDMLWKLACALDVEVSYFFAGLPPGDPPPVPVGDPTGLRLA